MPTPPISGIVSIVCSSSNHRRSDFFGITPTQLRAIMVIFTVLSRLEPAGANEFSATNSPLAVFQSAERVRAECLEGRRMICGKILRVLPDRLVVESGYTDLLRPPLTDSWLVPGDVSATRPPNLVESREPAAVCVGTVFLTDLPRARGKIPKPFDYVILLGYPAGEATYTSVGTVQKTVRRFTGTLAAAVKFQIGERRWSAVQLRMPADENGSIPKLLSQTGAFRDAATLTPADILVPYDVNVPFWSDSAEKTRWACVPPGEVIHFTPTGEWSFPPGAIFVKHFDIATDETHPDAKRRLETRLLVCNAAGGVYGVTYKWRADNSDAELLETNLTEDIVIKTAAGVRTQEWYYPSRADCLTCHTPNAGYVLGVKTRQLNRDFQYPNGKTENELVAWKNLGLLDADFSGADVKQFPALAGPADTSRTLEDRARSYLDANCAHCHRPSGTIAGFDARYDTPPAEQQIVGGHVLIDQRIDGARVVAPHDIWRSIMLMRVSTTEAYAMPPLARNTVDERGAELLREWIESLPGPDVLPPPEILPHGGNFSRPVVVTLQSEPGATIYYTLDGTVPTTDDLLYTNPFTLTDPTIVRAKAFKPGSTRSITAKEFFLFDH
jgi:uncharacterized repeat protein (TIGR03806 family)